MCGRAYSTFTEEELALRYLNKKPPKIPSFAPNYNLSPTQDAPIVRQRNGEREIALAHWGLIPPWAETFKMKFSTINAMSETLFDKPMYRGAARKRRCIVPLSGFYEWQKRGEKKQPFAIRREDGGILSLAGIWEAWHEGTPEERHSFSILTTAPNPFMARIHNRMPVILARESEELWLGEDSAEESVRSLFKACPDGVLAAHPVSLMVNSPKNNHPECIEPLLEN